MSVTQFRMLFFMFRLCVGVHWLANSIQIQLALVVRQYTIPFSVAVFAMDQNLPVYFHCILLIHSRPYSLHYMLRLTKTIRL